MTMQVIHRLFPFSRGLFEVKTLVQYTYASVLPLINSCGLSVGQGCQLLVFSITNYKDEGLYISNKPYSANVSLYVLHTYSYLMIWQ